MVSRLVKAQAKARARARARSRAKTGAKRIGSSVPRVTIIQAPPRRKIPPVKPLRPRRFLLKTRKKTGARGRKPQRVVTVGGKTGRLVKVRPTRVTVASPSGREGRTITVSSRSILARRLQDQPVKARGRVPIREGGTGRLLFPVDKTIITESQSPRPKRGKIPVRPTFTSFIPFQAEPQPSGFTATKFNGSTRGQKRSRQTPAGRKITRQGLTIARQATGFLTFDELGQIGTGIQQVGQRLGDTTVRQIFEATPIGAVTKKVRGTKFTVDKPFPFAKFGSDFDVLNFFG